MKPKISPIVEFFNRNDKSNNLAIIIMYLNDYIHSSHRFATNKPDGKLFEYQPSWPEKTVVSYSVYYDGCMSYNHKSGRITLIFNDNTTEEIGLHKFKEYMRKKETVLKRYKGTIIRELESQKVDIVKSINRFEKKKNKINKKIAKIYNSIYSDLIGKYFVSTKNTLEHYAIHITNRNGNVFVGDGYVYSDVTYSESSPRYAVISNDFFNEYREVTKNEFERIRKEVISKLFSKYEFNEKS